MALSALLCVLFVLTFAFNIYTLFELIRVGLRTEPFFMSNVYNSTLVQREFTQIYGFDKENNDFQVFFRMLEFASLRITY